MTLGYYAPLPPARSGVADYAASMLNGLRSLTEVRVNADGDVNLYHIGNNRLHAEIYSRALETPGLVVLHDAMLQHLFMGSFTGEEYEREFVYNYGEWNAQLARRLWQRRGRVMGDAQYFRYPMLRRLAERSLALVVHTAEARRALLDHHPGAIVAVIPHLLLDEATCTVDNAIRTRIRREDFGVLEGEMLAGVFGYLRETKRLSSVLRAVCMIRSQGLPLRLLVAGDFASEDYERALLPALETAEGVIWKRFAPEPVFRRWIASTDVCINLKYPSAGEGSGIAVRAMSLQVPVIVTEGVASAEFPSGTCFHAASGVAEVYSLAALLRWLFAHPRERRRVALLAQEWVERHASPDAVCRQIWTLAQAARSHPTAA